MGTIKKWKLVKVAVLEKWMPLTALQRACFNPKRAHHQMFRLQATALLFIVKSCYQKRWRGKSDICHSHFYILFFFLKTLFPWKGKTSNEPLTCWAHRLPSVNELTSTVTLLPAYVSGPQIAPPRAGTSGSPPIPPVCVLTCSGRFCEGKLDLYLQWEPLPVSQRERRDCITH